MKKWRTGDDFARKDTRHARKMIEIDLYMIDTQIVKYINRERVDDGYAIDINEIRMRANERIRDIFWSVRNEGTYVRF